MKKIVFATEEDHQHKKTILQKSVTRALTGTMPRPVFLCLQRNLTWISGHDKTAKQLFHFSFRWFWIVDLS